MPSERGDQQIAMLKPNGILWTHGTEHIKTRKLKEGFWPCGFDIPIKHLDTTEALYSRLILVETHHSPLVSRPVQTGTQIR